MLRVCTVSLEAVLRISASPGARHAACIAGSIAGRPARKRHAGRRFIRVRDSDVISVAGDPSSSREARLRGGWGIGMDKCCHKSRSRRAPARYSRACRCPQPGPASRGRRSKRRRW